MRSRRMTAAAFFAVPALTLSACAATGDPAAQPDCHAFGGAPSLVATLYFGRARAADTPVAETAWDDFLQSIVTPRFPEGLTVIDGAGQWYNPQTRQISREGTWILMIAAAQTPQTLRKLDEIRNAYKARFHQLSVGQVLSTGCADF